jgi:predicted N-acyltransferase
MAQHLSTARLLAGHVQVLDSAAKVPAAAWDDLVGPDDLFLSRRWLQVAEATSGIAMNYLLSQDAHGLSGGLATALVGPAAPWLLGRPDTVLERCAADGQAGAVDCRGRLPAEPGDVLMPSLVCGGRHLGRTRVLARQGEPGSVAAATERLVTAAEDLMREQQARCAAFLYVDERDTVLRRVLARRGYASFVSGRYSWLPVPDDGFDGYLAAFSAHHRRRIRAERRRLRAAGVEVRIEPLTADLITPVSRMDVSLLVKYGVPATQEQAEATFDRILGEFGADAMVATARVNDEICGFALVLRHGGQWYVYRCGFDYAVKGDLPVYFEMIYYHLVEAASAAGVPAIHYGTGSAEAKRSHGCVAVDQHAFLLTAS